MIGVSRRPPHLAFLCGLCVISGITIVASGPQPGSIVASLEHWQVLAWAWSLIICGTAILVTFFGRSSVVALRRERLMLVPLSLATVAYAGAVTYTNGWAGSFAAGLSLAFAAANLVRAWQITRWLRAVDATTGPTDG